MCTHSAIFFKHCSLCTLMKHLITALTLVGRNSILFYSFLGDPILFTRNVLFCPNFANYELKSLDCDFGNCVFLMFKAPIYPIYTNIPNIPQYTQIYPNIPKFTQYTPIYHNLPQFTRI